MEKSRAGEAEGWKHLLQAELVRLGDLFESTGRGWIDQGQDFPL